ncbi:unnamed protein product [Phytomonas sp. Hart1]|nr:unnamed protein product [Phytomonas sp. Hart1]|eukprot:CCW67361.1 unnamed protein product [Phytomonas sp. isolate Hart1]
MTRNQNPSRDDQKPLSPEARAALEQRLTELRAHESQRRETRHQTDASVTMGVPSVGAEDPSAYYNSDHVAGGDDSNDREDESFMNFIEDTFLNGGISSQRNASTLSPQQMQCTPGATTQSHHSSGTKCFLSQMRAFRDFEVLWFVKFGDITSFQDQCANLSIDIKTFCDNQNRNALHYAADNGSLSILELLATLGVPYLRSEKGMTPMDVAILTNQSSKFKSLLAKLAQGSNLSQEGNSVKEDERKTFEDVRKKFAPEPPKFVISRRPPTPAVFKQNVCERSFWKCQLAKGNGKDAAVLNLGAITKSLDAESGIHVVISDSNNGDLAAGVRVVNRLYTGWGISRFLRPLDHVVKNEKEKGIGCSASNKFVILTAIPTGDTMDKNSASDLPVGVIASRLLHGGLEGVGAATDVSRSGGKSSFAIVGHLAVDVEHQGKQVSSMLMKSLGNDLLVQHGCTALAFTMQTLIPQLPPSISMVKWYRRVLNANTVFEGPYAEDIFPEFYDEDEVLRADCVLKGTLDPMLRNTYAESVSDWRFVDGTDKNQSQGVFDFLHNRGKEGLELVWKWQSEEDLCSAFFPPDGQNRIKTLVRISGNKNVPEDFIVFRLRQMRHQRSRIPDFSAETNVEEGVSGGQDSIVVVQVVYAHFTVLKGVEKMSHILLIAQDLLQANVVLVPNLFGFTESDLVKSNFDEVTIWREMLYVLRKDERENNQGSEPAARFLPPIQASKISLPIFLL